MLVALPLVDFGALRRAVGVVLDAVGARGKVKLDTNNNDNDVDDNIDDDNDDDDDDDDDDDESASCCLCNESLIGVAHRVRLQCAHAACYWCASDASTRLASTCGRCRAFVALSASTTSSSSTSSIER